MVTSTNNTNIILLNLLVFTEYNVSVVAFTSVGNGPSTSTSVRTDSSVPEAPQNITASNISTTSIEVNWDPPLTFNGPNEGYNLTYRRLETNENTTVSVMGVSVIITDLEIYELYNIQVVALSDKGPGEAAEISVRTDEDLPGPVEMLTADELDSATISVKWDRPSEPNGIITEYEVEYSTMNTTLSVTVDGSMLSVELVNLNVFTEYEIRVRAFTRIGPGNYTDIVTVTTDPSPSGPVNVTATPDRRSINLTWTEPDMPNGDIQGYYISTNASFPSDILVSNLSSYGEVLNVSSDTRSLLFTGLIPFTYYQFSVAAYSFNFMDVTSNFTILLGNFSPDTISRTLEDSPTSPRSFSVEAVEGNPNSLMTSWTEPMDLNGILTNYSVYCRLSTNQFYPEQEPSLLEEQFTMRTSVDPASTSAAVTELEAFTNYDCYVTASTNGGESEPSNNNSARTVEDTPTAPTDFTVDITTATTVTLSWNRPTTPNGEISEYTIEYSNSSLNEPLSISIPVTYLQDSNEYNVTSRMINGLNEFTMYMFNISATNGGGTGPVSSINVTTNKAAPSAPPMNLKGVNTSSTSLFISWDPLPVDDRNGIILGYNITYFSTNEDTMVNSTTNTDIILMNLLVFTEYTVSVVAFTSVGSGPSTSITVSTDSDLPFMPTDISIPFLTATSLFVQWDPPTDVRGFREGYFVQYNLSPSDYTYLLTNYSSITRGVDSFNVSLKMLHEFAEYTISVQAVNDKGPGNIARITQATNQSVPGNGVRNVSIDVLSSTAVNVSWLPPKRSDWNGLLTMYAVSYESVDNNLRVSFDGSVELMQRDFINGGNPGSAPDPLQREFIVISGLEEAITYSFTVTVSTNVGPNVDADTPPSVQAITAEDVPDAPPLNVTIAVLNSLSANVSWAPPLYINRNGMITAYNVTVSDSSGSVILSERIQNNYYVAENLPQFASFSVVVSALTSQGPGPASAPVTAMTLEGLPSEPTRVSLAAASQTSISVTWSTPTLPNGVIIGYYIFYYGEKESGVIFDGLYENLTAVIPQGNATSFQITNLLSDTTYSVNVTAFTATGNGTTGIGGTVSLPRGDPPTLPPDSNFSIGEPPTDDSGTTPTVTTSTIPISFTIPESLNANGPIMRVRIICRPFGSSSDTITTYFLSSSTPPPNSPPYFALEVDLDESRKRGLVRRQENGEMTISETIGSELNCGVDDQVCNGPLQPGTEYEFKYRAYNSEDDDSYVESPYSPPVGTAQTPSKSNTAAIVAVIVVIIVLIIVVGVVIVVVVLFVRGRRKKKLYSFAGYTNGTSDTLLKDGSKAKLINAGPSIVPLSENTTSPKDNFKTAPVKATPHSRKIYLRDLPGYVSDMVSDSGFKFSEEYEKVSAIGLDHSRDASLLPENRAKNRYTNILAYDHSRVKLDYVDDEPGSDYINANYIPGYKIRRAYIASQGPLPSTFDDFWTMVWQQNVHNIVMLTQLVERGRTKCHRYWPGSQPEVYDDITVEMSSEREETDWVIRAFELTKDKRSRTVHQFQFISWPDHGVPETATAAIDFVSCIHAMVQPMHGPILVHCSAGVGRTGTFIALGTLLHHIKDHDWIDIFGLACEMRQHRNHMIQTEAQYIFIHKAMVEVCQSLSTFSDAKKLQGFSPIYVNIGAGTSPGVSQQSDYMFGNSLLSEETAQFVGKSYDESKF